MKKSILFLFCCFALSFSCFSQDCELLYQSAMQYFEKEEYEQARSRFVQVVNDCGKGGDYRGALAKIKECEDKIAEKNQPNLKVYPSKLTFGVQGGTQTIKVTSPSSWMYGNCPNWLKLTKNSQTKLTVDCAFNDSGKERKADITIISEDNTVRKKIRVVQEQSKINVSTTYVEFPGNGGNPNLIFVTCDGSWSVEGMSGDWFFVKKNSDGVIVSCEENPSTGKRDGYFNIKAPNGSTEQITVSQKGSNPRLEVPESVFLAWNEDTYIIPVNSNMNWTVKVSDTWCSAAKHNDKEIVLRMSQNNLDKTRTADVLVTAGNITKTIKVTQRVFGYVALYEDYFKNIGGKKRVTKASVSVYALGNNGLRASAFMYRWKVAEIDLLNINMSYSNNFFMSWEPMIRGYLPLTRDGHFWTAYMGLGRIVPIYEEYPYNHSHVLFEMGAEGRMFKRDDISTRFFLRIDGAFSLGVAFDLNEWK